MELANRALIFILLSSTSFSHCSDHSLPSKINVDEFLEIEEQMITKMKTFISRDRDRLDVLKRRVREWKEWRESYRNKEDDYIAIPTNLIHLFKKLTVDFPILESMTNNNCYNDTMSNDEITPPTDDHLKTLVLSLVELQYTYDLNPKDIINGKIKDFTANTALSEEACLLIGETCLENNQHLCAVEWLSACATLTSDEEKLKKIYKKLYPSYLFLNNKEKAHEYAYYYLVKDPLDVPASDVTIELGYQLGKLRRIEPQIIETRGLCSGFYDDLMRRRNFKCRYNSENSPFLKIAPLKEEQIFDDPEILVYREVLYDSEIEAIKSWAVAEMKTATVYSNDGKSRVTGFIYRISQSAFLNNTTPFVSDLHNRMIDISDLSLKGSEFMQVINYSPGGFYRIHSDYLPRNTAGVDTLGNRMATLLFYMNDVPLGGETVFPRIKVGVKPVKGSVLVWHNVLPDGTENILTQHSACPVLLGEKWAFTQWIRSMNQKSIPHVYKKYGKESSTNSERKGGISYQKPRNFGTFVQEEFRTLIGGVSGINKMIDN